MMVAIKGVQDPPPRRLRRLGIAILVAGLGSAIAIYIRASARPENPLGYDPLETKKYVRDLEMYGGKANVLATQVREWFVGLWHGTNLAFTVAALTVLLVLVMRFFSMPLPPRPIDDGSAGARRP
ncbi:MAG TPA: hypothetical protein VKF32_13920 [Thermoanaerobaculia bacterium]|nr:hypothetical protein [Thermoanaerobaculia bacterium]